MKLNRIPVIDLSTAHFSEITLGWMSEMADFERDMRLRAKGAGPVVSVMEREEGFFLSTHHVDPEIGDPTGIPPDLAHVLRFARANGADYVLVDRDAEPQEGLPVYFDGGDFFDINMIDRSESFIGDGEGVTTRQTVLGWKGDTKGKIEAVVAGKIPDAALLIEERKSLEDGDHLAPEGCWLSVGEASIRIGIGEESIWTEILPLGCEMGESFGRIEVLREDLRQAIRDEAAAEEASPSP
jgi:hypothetical protein